MAEAAQKQSESMEDILQSIKRIIEDDTGTDAKPATAPETAVTADVLELTQALRPDGSVEELAALPPAARAEPPKTEPKREEVKPAPVAAVNAPPPAFPTAARASRPAAQPLAMEEGLVSDQATQAAVAALKPIADSSHKDYSIPHIPSSALRNGNTVEDLVLEALKPMLKAWLDEHLPLIVQKIVEKEVKRIVKFHQD